MKRMVKNGDLIDVEPDGSITVAGKPIGGGGGGITKRELVLDSTKFTNHLNGTGELTSCSFTSEASLELEAFFDNTPAEKNILTNIRIGIVDVDGVSNMGNDIATKMSNDLNALERGKGYFYELFGTNYFISKIGNNFEFYFEGSTTSMSVNITSFDIIEYNYE